MAQKQSQTPRPQIARLADIAAMAGVGIATVDRVLNERGNVSEKTTHLVQDPSCH
jgi:LacI family transcriptional regulator